MMNRVIYTKARVYSVNDINIKHRHTKTKRDFPMILADVLLPMGPDPGAKKVRIHNTGSRS